MIESAAENGEGITLAAYKVNSSLKHVNRNVQATKNASIPPRSGDNLAQSTDVRVY
jgi:hypothetical protein